MSIENHEILATNPNQIDRNQIVPKIANKILDLANIYPVAPEKSPEMESLETLRGFFKIDEKIKSIMTNLTPPFYTELGYGDGIFYSRKLINGMNSIDIEFDDLAQKLEKLGIASIEYDADGKPINSLVNRKNQLMINFRSEVDKSGCEFNELSRIYHDDVSNMDIDFIKYLNREMSGYYLDKNPAEAIYKSKTFDELLHAVHMDVCSNEELYSKLPKWGNFQNEDVEYAAYGEENLYARDVFEKVSEAVCEDRNDEKGNLIYSAGEMQLFSFDNVTQLLIRDFGHALSIEIDTSHDDAAIVRYSIPKITNVEMVNKLPGVRKIKTISDCMGTDGRFLVDYEGLGDSIAQFVLKVPTDAAMDLRKYNN